MNEDIVSELRRYTEAVAGSVDVATGEVALTSAADLRSPTLTRRRAAIGLGLVAMAGAAGGFAAIRSTDGEPARIVTSPADEPGSTTTFDGSALDCTPPATPLGDPHPDPNNPGEPEVRGAGDRSAELIARLATLIPSGFTVVEESEIGVADVALVYGDAAGTRLDVSAQQLGAGSVRLLLATFAEQAASDPSGSSTRGPSGECRYSFSSGSSSQAVVITPDNRVGSILWTSVAPGSESPSEAKMQAIAATAATGTDG